MLRWFHSTLALVALSGALCAQESVGDARPQDRLQAIDPTGVWVWEQSFGGRSRESQIELTVASGSLSGTFGAPQTSGRPNAGRFGSSEPVALTNVQLIGDKISFDVTRKFGENEFTTSYSGVMAGDEIAGVSVSSFGGQVRELAWLAKRKQGPTQSEPVVAASAPEKATPDKNEEPSSAGATAGPNAELSEIPAPARIPDPGEVSDLPYTPRAILPGGIVMPLYPADSPFLNKERIKEAEKYSLSDSVHGRINSIVNIHNPSIEVHFSSPSMNTGTVIILAAGGGHRTLNVGTESADFVHYLFNYGINTVILRNRLRSDGYEPTTDAVRDALQAIRLVRKHAERWKFAPNRIGIMGFSAGAELSAPAAIQFAKFDQENSGTADPLAGVSSRPDFVGVIYPGPTPFTRAPETEVPRNTPPAFITCAGAGDRIHALWATDYFAAMLKAGIPNVEMHIYGNGYHPGDKGSTGGLTHRKGIPFGTWHLRFVEWLDDLGFLADPSLETKAAKDIQEFLSQPPPRRRGDTPSSQNRASNEPNKPEAPVNQNSPVVSNGVSAKSDVLAGTWTVKFDTRVGEQTYEISIDATEANLTITGNVVSSGRARELVVQDVTRTDNGLKFVELMKINENEVRIEFTAVHVDGVLKITRKVGEFASSEAVATRAAEANR